MDFVDVLSSGRISPITTLERNHLIDLISEEHILQSRKTDGKVLLQKRQAWARIAHRFNSQNPGCKRTELQLKKVWERLKVKVKHDDAKYKREVKRTGSGAPPKDLPPETERIAAMVGPEMHDLGNSYDDDFTPMAKSHRQGRLIRFTKSLLVREVSTSRVCEVVSIDEGAALDPEPFTITVSTQPPTKQDTSQPVKLPSKKRISMNTRRAREDDDELCDVPNDLRGGSLEKDMHDKFLERRQHLLELQIKHMEIRIAEAEERKEEARIWKEIAKKELEKQ